MSDYSGGYSGPGWADVWLTAAEIEREVRGRVVIRLGGSKLVKTGANVEVLIARQLTRSSYDTIAHATGVWPTKRHRTMPGLLIALIYEAAELAAQHDARPWAQWTVDDLPFPPDGG